jgi:hypothetical protein
MKKELTKPDIYAIYYMFDNGSDIKAISKELNITASSIKDALNNRETNNNNKIKTTSSKVNSKNLMITETSAKGNNTVAIMTKAASEINDAFRKTLDNSVISRTGKSAIYRPNQNKK